MTETLPTKGRANAMEKIELSTQRVENGFTAKCTVDGEILQTSPKERVTDAINHLIDVVVDIKKEEGKKRDFDYKFVIPFKQ